jgi:Xaa-Pro aminopeptidase
MLGFETLTLAPIERRLIKASMLDRAELTWLNNYHARVLAIHEMALSKDEADWLKNACAPL